MKNHFDTYENHSGFECPEWDCDTKQENLLKKKCPECNFDTKEKNLLEDHFTENHPLSSVFLKRPECDFDKQRRKFMQRQPSKKN